MAWKPHVPLVGLEVARKSKEEDTSSPEKWLEEDTTITAQV